MSTNCPKKPNCKLASVPARLKESEADRRDENDGDVPKNVVIAVPVIVFLCYLNLFES